MNYITQQDFIWGTTDQRFDTASSIPEVQDRSKFPGGKFASLMLKQDPCGCRHPRQAKGTAYCHSYLLTPGLRRGIQGIFSSSRQFWLCQIWGEQTALPCEETDLLPPQDPPPQRCPAAISWAHEKLSLPLHFMPCQETYFVP